MFRQDRIAPTAGVIETPARDAGDTLDVDDFDGPGFWQRDDPVGIAQDGLKFPQKRCVREDGESGPVLLA